jgi:hypothetical protein
MAFNPAPIRTVPIDYDWISSIPENFWKGQQIGRAQNLQGSRDTALAQFQNDGDYGGLAKELLRAGDIEGAATIATIGRRLNPGQPKQSWTYNKELGEYYNKNDPSQTRSGPQGPSMLGPDGPKKVPYKVPANYRLKDPNDPSKGVTPIEGGPAFRLPQGDAGALAMLDAAEKAAAAKRANGQPLISALTENYSTFGMGPLQYETQHQLKSGDVGRAERVIRTKVEAALRMMTGAAAPQEEVDRYTDFYTPGSMDMKETAEQKLKLLDDFAIGAREYMLRGRSGEKPVDPMGKQTDRMAPEGQQPYDAGSDPGNESQYPEAGPQPDETDMKKLTKFQADPAFRDAFEAKYGKGAVDRWLNNDGWTGR